MSEYPSEDVLQEIEKFSLTERKVEDLLEIVKEAWNDIGNFVLIGKSKKRLELHTGGWSGNEDIINALRNNRLFFPIYWYKSERGGHYYFKIP